MPLYLYHCQSCGREHEQLQKFSDPPLKHCPSCKGRLVKQITSTSFHLKGGGWYKDGYSSPRPEKKSEGEPKPAEKKEPGGSAKKEAKEAKGT